MKIIIGGFYVDFGDNKSTDKVKQKSEITA